MTKDGASSQVEILNLGVTYGWKCHHDHDALNATMKKISSVLMLKMMETNESVLSKYKIPHSQIHH